MTIKHRPRSGMTLVEVAITLVLIGIIARMAMPRVAESTRRLRMNRAVELRGYAFPEWAGCPVQRCSPPRPWGFLPHALRLAGRAEWRRVDARPRRGNHGHTFPRSNPPSRSARRNAPLLRAAAGSAPIA